MAKVDAAKEIRRAVDTGKVVFGSKQSEKSILNGSGGLVVLSGNTPELLRERVSAQAKVSGIPVYGFSGSSAELGALCGKPFVVSVMVIEGKGKSRVLELADDGKR